MTDNPPQPRRQRNADDQKSGAVIIPTAVALAVVSLLTTGLNYYIQRQNGVQLQEQTNQVQSLQEGTTKLAANSLGSLEKGQKLCRVLQGKTWRDGLIVPQNWTISLCVDYMKKTGGNGYQLGCIYQDGTNLGGENGSIPSPNCGWQ